MKMLQRQSEGSDERLRLLQNDKELLAHQVHMLTEQVSAQNEKINDLERLISDKAQHASTTEDLLQRVWKLNGFVFYFLSIFLSLYGR